MVDNLGISDVGNGTEPLNMLDAVSSLKEAGFEQEQAEAVVRMQYGLIGSHLATKRDIEANRTELKRDIEANRTGLKRDIEAVRTELKRDIKELDSAVKYRIAIASTGMVVTLLGGIVALAKLGILTVS